MGDCRLDWVSNLLAGCRLSRWHLMFRRRCDGALTIRVDLADIVSWVDGCVGKNIELWSAFITDEQACFSTKVAGYAKATSGTRATISPLAGSEAYLNNDDVATMTSRERAPRTTCNLKDGGNTQSIEAASRTEIVCMWQEASCCHGPPSYHVIDGRRPSRSQKTTPMVMVDILVLAEIMMLVSRVSCCGTIIGPWITSMPIATRHGDKKMRLAGIKIRTSSCC